MQGRWSRNHIKSCTVRCRISSCSHTTYWTGYEHRQCQRAVPRKTPPIRPSEYVDVRFIHAWIAPPLLDPSKSLLRRGCRCRPRGGRSTVTVTVVSMYSMIQSQVSSVAYSALSIKTESIPATDRICPRMTRHERKYSQQLLVVQ